MAKPKTAEAKTDTKANETVEPPKPEATIGRELTEDEKKALGEAEKIRADIEEREWIDSQKLEVGLAVEAHTKAEERAEELRKIRDAKTGGFAKYLHDKGLHTEIDGVTYKPILHAATHGPDGKRLPDVKGTRRFDADTYTLIRVPAPKKAV